MDTRADIDSRTGFSPETRLTQKRYLTVMLGTVAVLAATRFSSRKRWINRQASLAKPEATTRELQFRRPSSGHSRALPNFRHSIISVRTVIEVWFFQHERHDGDETEPSAHGRTDDDR